MRAENRQGVNRLQSAKRGAFPSPALPRSRPPGFSRARLVATAAIVLAAGCADLRWQKDGMDAPMQSRDLDECRQLARAQAAREAWPLGPSGAQIVGADVQGRVIVSNPGQVDTNRYLVEQDLTRACMSGKGYKLVPAKER